MVVYIQVLNFEDVVDIVCCRVNLVDVCGVKFIFFFDDVILLVDIYVEKSVEVFICGINFLFDKVFCIFFFKVQVIFQVGLSYFKFIIFEDFFIGVIYEFLLNNKGEKCLVNFKFIF